MTAPSCRMTRLPITTPSRIDTCERTMQSSPIRRARTDDDVWIDDGARADGRAGADGHERSDGHVRAEGCVRSHRACGIDALRRHRRVRQQIHRVRERQIGLFRQQKRGGGPHRTNGGGCNDGRGARRRELPHIFFVGDEGQVPRLRLFDAGDAPDLDVTVAFQTAIQPSRQSLEAS